MRTAAALVIAIATWIGAQVLAVPAAGSDTTWELGEQVSHSIAADLAEVGAARLELEQLREDDLEWLPALLLQHGWTSTTSDRCECLYPPVASSA
jgi:hypothetical protein